MIDYRGYLSVVLDTDLSSDLLCSAGDLKTIDQDGEDVLFTVSLLHKKPRPGLLYFEPVPEETDQELFFRVRFYSGGIIRLLISLAPRPFIEQSLMLDWDPALHVNSGNLQETEGNWLVTGQDEAFFNIGKGKFDLNFFPTVIC